MGESNRPTFQLYNVFKLPNVSPLERALSQKHTHEHIMAFNSAYFNNVINYTSGHV